MKRIQFKLIISDDIGAPIYQKLALHWDSAKQLDDTYMGPEFYWSFYQWGDFDQIDATLVKWENWSTWRIPKAPDSFNKGAMIGATCLLVFWDPKDEKSVNQMKTVVDQFLQVRRATKGNIVAFPLYEKAKSTSHILLSDENVQAQIDWIKGKDAVVDFLDRAVLEGDLKPFINNVYRKLLRILQPQMVDLLDLDEVLWHVPLSELRAILFAELKGIKLRPRRTPPPPPIAEPVFSHTPEVTPTIPTEVAAAPASPPVDMDHVAISPTGEVVPLKPDITHEEIIEMVKKGYKLPPWVVIPRHCPKCFNQNQRSIREVIDKDVILMENPRIYGMKYVCGACGHNFKMNM
jgi:hypothetical protein